MLQPGCYGRLAVASEQQKHGSGVGRATVLPCWQGADRVSPTPLVDAQPGEDPFAAMVAEKRQRVKQNKASQLANAKQVWQAQARTGYALRHVLRPLRGA